MILINPRDGMNSSEGIRMVTPGVLPPEGGMTGSAVPKAASWHHRLLHAALAALRDTFLVSYGAFGHGYGLTTQEIDPKDMPCT